MDEFFCIEGVLGEIKGIVGLQFEEEQYIQQEKDIIWEKFPEPEAKEDKPADDQNPDDPPPDVNPDDDEPKKEVFKKEDYNWTVTNGQSKNLPQLFNGIKGINTLNDKKEIDCVKVDRNTKQGQADYDNWMNGQISECLNGFCTRLTDNDNQDKFLYQQVIFKQK
jgi:hypothetical protein